MARLISIATGNFTAAGTWAVSDATALLDSEGANTALTTSYVTSSTFTPGAITIDGIAVKIALRDAGSPSNTISVALDLATVTVVGTEVTINVADIDVVTAQSEGGWYLFKFAAPVLLVAATAYGVKAKVSATTTAVNLFSSATTNWARQLRTTTTAAPGAADVMDVIGEHTGAGTGNSFVVTMDSEATTDFGAGTDGVVAMTIGKRGTMTYGVVAAKAYYLKLSGDLILYSGGTLNMGTSGARMPSDSSGVLEFDPVADGGMRLHCRNGSTWNAYGNNVTTTQTTLSADEAAAQTVLSITSTAGWEAGKDIGIASTTRTPGDTEVRVIDTVDSATQVTVTAGLTNAHGGGGTALVIAEVVYLWRNVIVRSATSTLMTAVYVRPTANVHAEYVLFRYLGDNVAGERGIEIETTTGTVSFTFCVLRDCEDQALFISTATGSVVFADCTFYNCNSTGVAAAVNVAITSGAHDLSDTWVIGGGAATTITAMAIADSASDYSRCRVAGHATSASVGAIVLNDVTSMYTLTSDIVIHSCGGFGIQTSGLTVSAQLYNTVIYRNAAPGIFFGGGNNIDARNVTLFGNAARNILAATTGLSGLITFSSCTSRSDATFSTTFAMSIQINCAPIYFLNCSFSQGTAHTTEFDILAGVHVRIVAVNCLGVFGSVNNQTTMAYASVVSVHKVNQVADVHKSFQRYGTIDSEATTRHTASGIAWKMDPNNASNKMRLPGPTELDTFKSAVPASLVTLNGWVRKNAAYNGNAPRLVVVGGILGGVGSWGTDVTDSLTVAADTWEELSVTFTPTEAGVVEYYFDCDGTAGDAFVDDVTVSF